MTFGDKWRAQPVSYYDAMHERCKGLWLDRVITDKVLGCTSVNEIGCGAGHFAQSLFDAGYSGRYWGCDFSSAALQAAHQRLAGTRHKLVQGQFELLIPSDSDITIGRSVIQHQKHWLPMTLAALCYSPLVVYGVCREDFIKESGPHDVTERDGYYDVRLSLDTMHAEANNAGLKCRFERNEGRLGVEVVASFWRAE